MRLLEVLSERPAIGMAGSFGSSGLLMVHDVFTNESVLKLVSAMGIYVGFGVGILTLILKGIELVERIKSRKG